MAQGAGLRQMTPEQPAYWVQNSARKSQSFSAAEAASLTALRSLETLECWVAICSSRWILWGEETLGAKQASRLRVQTPKHSVFLAYWSPACAHTPLSLYNPKGRSRGNLASLQLTPRCCKKWTSRHRYCLLYTSPSPRDLSTSRMPSSA